MKTIYLLIFLFYSPILFSQINHFTQKKNESYEGFINQISEDFIPIDYKYYYLQQKAYPIDHDDIESIYYQNETIRLYDLREKISDVINVKYEWKINAIEKARVCNLDSLRLSPRNLNPITYVFVDSLVTNSNRIVESKIFLVTVKKRWGLNRKIKEGDIQWKMYKDNYRYEDYECFSFSVPVFFNNENNALIVFKDRHQTIYCVYSKKNNKWYKERDIMKLYRHY